MKSRHEFPTGLRFVFCCFSVVFLCLSAIPGIATEKSESEIAAALRPMVEAGEMPGFVVLIADKEEVLHVDAIGYADLDSKRPMEKDTLFWIASSSKPFAAAAVMVLVDEGKINLDDPISKYLPEFWDLKVAHRNEDGSVLLKKPKNMPTVRQSLAHTSGWAFISPYMERYGIDSLSPMRSASTYAMMSLQYEPGEKYVYSNIGINITSAIVERVSGMPFEEFMKKRIFEPLEMHETTYVPTSKQMEKLATSYGFDKEKKALKEIRINFLTYPLDDPHIRFAEAGGGIFSTAPEIVKFFQMLANDGQFKGKRILSKESVEKMRTKQTGDLENQYGLGLGLFGDFYGHGGAYGNDAVIHKPTGTVCIYMVQVAGVPMQGEAKNRYNQAVLKMFQNGKLTKKTDP